MVTVRVSVFAAPWNGIPVLTAAFGYYDALAYHLFFLLLLFFNLTSTFLLRVVLKMTHLYHR